jgi:hypothetical protein
VPSSTIAIAASGDDGYLEQWSTAYGGTDGSQDTDTAFGEIYVRNDFMGFGGTNQYVRGNIILRFDTSSLPDNSIVTAATLELRSVAGFYADTDNRSLQIEWLADPGTITFASDFNATPAASAKAATDLTSLAASTSYSWPLLNPDVNISRVAATGLRFHVDGASPTAGNRIGFYSFDHATEPAPQLVITYSFPPTLRTVSAGGRW